MYNSASFYPECKFLFIAERPSSEEYRSRPRLRWGEDEIAAIRKALQKITRHRISDVNDAEDIVQDTLLTMISRNPGEELKKGLLVWCQGILRNKVGNYYRKAGRHAILKEKHSGIEQLQLQPRAVATPEISASHKELRLIIEEKLAELPPEIRRVMELLVSGLNAGEIARLLSPEPYQNVMNRLYRGRKKLARELIKCGFGPNSANTGNPKIHDENIPGISRKIS
ncbi:MAG: RNA polymerase sigma factor [Acidobacteria bacterium]|nr:RNA polymerase sigma factor [Acidobacteriota bacterium]